MHSKNLGTYLDQADGINSLMPQAKRLLVLRQVLLESLPAPLAEFANVANLRQGKVVVFAANSSIAAKLRLLGPALKERLAGRGIQVTALEIEVQPAQRTVSAPRKAAVLTEAARQALTGLSTQLPDSELKNTILALAANKVSKR